MLKKNTTQSKKKKKGDINTSKMCCICFLGALLIASLCCRAPWVRIIFDGKKKCAPLSYLPVSSKNNYDQIPSQIKVYCLIFYCTMKLGLYKLNKPDIAC
jgi:hypothetical protein